MCGYIGKIFFNDPIKSEFDFLVYTLYLLIWKKVCRQCAKLLHVSRLFFFFLTYFKTILKALKALSEKVMFLLLTYVIKKQISH